MFNEYPDVLTVAQLAKALGIGKNTAYKLVNTKEIASIEIGKRKLIPKTYLLDYVNRARYNINRS